MIRPTIHLILHAAVPLLFAITFYKRKWKSAWAIMMITMLVDLDHLLANPVFNPDRCSIGFHPLHTWPALTVYGLLALIPRARIAALGLLVHMALDWIDCIWMGL